MRKLILLRILQVVQLTKFDYRLANNIDEELQKLRCRVNYHALRFTKPIQELGQKLVLRMRRMTHRYIAVHLRFVSSTKKGGMELITCSIFKRKMKIMLSVSLSVLFSSSCVCDMKQFL